MLLNPVDPPTGVFGEVLLRSVELELFVDVPPCAATLAYPPLVPSQLPPDAPLPPVVALAFPDSLSLQAVIARNRPSVTVLGYNWSLLVRKHSGRHGILLLDRFPPKRRGAPIRRAPPF